MKNLNHKEQRKLAEIQKAEMPTAVKPKGLHPGQAWEFENYIKERLKALGIIQ